ncbi:MAG: ATP-binding cassette domain-containing protein, partial [Solirubrobacterales bacterium]|nr:ATP-binding cassette domain-containing protein [Solirubrobacterales bacterium]
MSALAINLEGVSVARNGRAIVSDVDLEVGRGEFIAVLGPNGAGKSTLMKALLGLVPIAAGRATVLDRAPVQARSEVGYLPQRRGFDHATRIRGADLVRLGLD